MLFLKDEIIAMALDAGFSCAAFLQDTLVCALPYGNADDAGELCAASASDAVIAPFARRNYYREAVRRLQKISAALRAGTAYKKSDFRIFCNSRINEKQLAAAAGLGSYGRNGLIITRESGSLVVLAALELPCEEGNGERGTGNRFSLRKSILLSGNFPVVSETDEPVSSPFPVPCSQFPIFSFCHNGPKDNPPCVAACPTSALRGDGSVE
jgi:epoxyqueuosine reductase QueG